MDKDETEISDRYCKIQCVGSDFSEAVKGQKSELYPETGCVLQNALTINVI